MLSFCRREPAAAFLGFFGSGSPFFSCNSHSSAKLERGIYTSPRTSNSGSFSGMFNGIVRIVLRLGVISSPINPSPRVEPSVNTPSRYSSETDKPSIFGSTVNSYAPSPRTRSTNALTSSTLKTSCKLPICTSWRTFAKVFCAVPPTRCDGESSVNSSGKSCSRPRSSRIKASYSSSSRVGASRS